MLEGVDLSFFVKAIPKEKKRKENYGLRWRVGVVKRRKSGLEVEIEKGK